MDTDRAALNRRPAWLVPALAAVPAGTIALFFMWPVGTLLARVLQPGSVADALGVPGLARVLWFTVWQAVASTILTLLAGFAPAYALARFRFPGRRLVLALTTVPFMLPTVVVGAAFIALLPESWHGTGRAVVAAHVFFNVAVVVRLVGAMWTVLPPDLTGAARTLGATQLQVLRHVVLPLLRPSLIAAATVVFLFTFTSFGAAALLGGAANPTLEVEIARRATQLGDVGGAAVLSVLQLVLLVGVVWWSARAQRRAALQLGSQVPRRCPRAPQERRLVLVVVTVTVAVMAAPLLAMVLRSVRLGGRLSLTAWSELGTPTPQRPGAGLGVDAVASLVVSVRYAAVATAIALTVGALASFAIAAARRHGKLLDLGMMLPLGTSAVTVGLGMLITFDTAPFDWRSEWWLVPVGHALVAIPFVVRAALPVLRAVPDDQRSAAAMLGASPLRAWWWVDVRRSWRALASGAGIAAAVSLGEFGATTLLTRAGRETLPIAIARLLGRAGEVPQAQAFALATILLAVTAVIVVAADREEVAGAARS